MCIGCNDAGERERGVVGQCGGQVEFGVLPDKGSGETGGPLKSYHAFTN